MGAFFFSSLLERSIHSPRRVLFQLLDRVNRSPFRKDQLKGLFSLSAKVYYDVKDFIPKARISCTFKFDLLKDHVFSCLI